MMFSKFKKLLSVFLIFSLVFSLFISISMNYAEAALSEDINGDGVVNMADVILIASHFNTVSGNSNYDIKCDLNKDNVVNMSDVVMIAGKFNSVSAPTATSTSKPTPSPTVTPTPTSTLKPTATATLKPTDTPTVKPTATSPSGYSAYVMGYFKESPNGSENSPNLHIAVSTDALNWTPLNQNNYVLKPAMGTKCLRDPFFCRKKDGTFVIVATDNWNSEYIHIWDSKDLTSFTNERLVRMNTTGMHAWAPETFYDASKGQYAIIWSGNTDRNRIYVSYTSDFVNVTSPQVFFDPGFSVIDGHMEVGVNGYNYLYYKSEKDFKLYGTKSTTLNPGSFNANTYTTGCGAPFTGSHTEAAIVMKSLTSNTWWLWGDSYNPVNAVFYAWQTNDITTNSWKAVDKKFYNAPMNAKHATIAAITATEYNNLISKYGAPTWNRLKSYNAPDKYVRHSNSDCLIASAPFDPTADMQWKIVPGLADPNGVSFESVNTPGSYLRHSNYVLTLQKNDGSTTFKQDATFYKKPGFSDSSWTSFSSYNNPDRYIRNLNSKLQIDPITSGSSDTDKQSATFMICY